MADEGPRRLSLSRTRSRPDRPESPEPVYSVEHLDDHSIYHHDHAAAESDRPATGDDSEVEKKDNGQDDNGSIEVPEVRDGIPDVRDVEKADLAKEQAKSDAPLKDPNSVGWDGPEDPANPKNWSIRRKWAACLVVSAFTFISPVSSSMVAPALPAISKDLGVNKDIEEALILSIFVLAYAVGPLVLGPLSEVYGRVLVLQCANAFYLAWNLGCGFAKTKGQMMAFRFLSGLGGSAPLAIGGGTLSDMFLPEQRGKAISMYSLGPLIGPAAGPIAGGFIAQYSTWRWAFWATSIVDAAIQILGFFYLQETYAPVLLKWKAARLRKETGNAELRSEFDSDKTISKVLGVALVRPFRLLFTQPIIQFLAAYMAFLYGLMYLVLSTFPSLWTTAYHESVAIGGLNFISLAVGFFVGIQVAARLNDKIYVRLKRRNAGVGLPEFRVPLMVPGALLVPVGLLWYGWSAQARVHWIMPDIGAAIFAAGVMVAFQCIQTYLVDSYTRFAASAISAATVLRSLAGFGFPLFAPYMYQALDDGWGNTLLGLIGVVLGLPAPVILWKYGKVLRAKSQFAAGG
ncbi:mfs multidrug transporter [Diplodia corticola]|uniref:Mfs multidrug transporter n=1 Tax=Diplodia corticola TaxID=236234 RepID=A0A1J9QQZ1_9PEZI|nr:mfs multidrug transporter [Diplodia corticola]OJD30864.1 mfs multidrug transporter [Diplodia corticola]